MAGDDANIPTLQHFIGGKRVAGESNRFGDIYNPATGQIQARVPFATAGEVGNAIEAAKAAFPGWAATPASQRARLLFRYRDLVEAHRDELAHLCSAEHGKTLDDARGSVTRGIEIVEFACGIPQLLKGELNENVANGVDSFNMRQPLGVCAGITPFNFPAMVPMWMYPIALACGNTFVLKPSEKDPSCGLRLAELAVEAGVPPGVLNVVNGDKEAVDTLLTHEDVAAVSFVGSTPIAEYVHRTATAAGKRVQALGGAKNHLVVMPDADMEQVTDALIGSAYGSAGERCMAVAVAVAVGDEVADDLIERLAPRVESLKIGAFDAEGVEMGPLVTREHRDKVRATSTPASRKARPWSSTGVRPLSKATRTASSSAGASSTTSSPTCGSTRKKSSAPVLSIVRANDYEEAVGLVNDHELGNGAAIFTRDGDAARDFTHRVRIGMVGVNVPIPVPTAYHSFGGWKRSLFGDHHMHGPEGVRFFTRMKTVTSRWPSGIREGAAFNFKRSTEA